MKQHYELYDKVITNFGPTTQTDFGYTFQRNMPGMGLMDYKAWLRFVLPRSYCEEGFYDPTTGSFIQPDTIIPEGTDPGLWNRYIYANNNPLSFTDPTGHFPLLFILAMVGIVIMLSQTPSDVVQAPPGTDCGNRCGDPEVFKFGVELIIFAPAIATTFGSLAMDLGIATNNPNLFVNGQEVVESANPTIVFNTNQDSSSATTNGSWRVGDPIDAPTSHGEPSWSTVRRRYWMNAAANASSGEYSEKNLIRMQSGYPPLDDEFGVPMELHHSLGRNITNANSASNLLPVWPWQHAAIDPFRKYNGPNPGN